MDIRTFVKKRHQGEGRTRVIDKDGKVIVEKYDDYGGISIDWVQLIDLHRVMFIENNLH